MADGINLLTKTVIQRLRAFQLPLPSAPVIEKLLRTVYVASLRTEENRFVRGSVTFADPKFPDIYPPQLRRADYPSFVGLRHKQKLTPQTLAKLFRAVDQWSGSIAVFGRSATDMFAWGIVDQLVQQNVRLHRERLDGFSNPGVLTITVDGVGDLSVYHADVLLSTLRGNELVRHETDVLHSSALASKFMPHFLPAATAIVRSLGPAADKAACAAQIFSNWAATLSRLCIGIRRLGTGGSLLVSPAPIIKWLDIPNKLDYRRLGDSAILSVLDDMYLAKVAEELDDDEFADMTPSSLLIDHSLAEADAQDRQSEVTGAVKLVTSLAAIDGLVLLGPTLNVLGFGVKIRAARNVAIVYDGDDFGRRGVGAKRVDLARFGTRHTSMLRYCRADPNSFGIVVSQDGNVRLVMTAGQSLVLWDNVQLRGHKNYTARTVKELTAWNEAQLGRPNRIELGYSPMPKTMAKLLRRNKEPQRR